MKIVNIFLFFSLSISLLAQNNFTCATDIVEQQWVENDPIAAQNLEVFNELAQNAVLNQSDFETEEDVIIIPVVVHVIYADESDNISREQILNAIEHLNIDYRRQNVDTIDTRPLFQSVANDMKIEFRLARKDPNGNCTDGITRHQSNNAINANDNVKNVGGTGSTWNNKKYLNIWTVRNILISGTTPGQIVLGYAYKPNPGQGYKKDGIVIRHDQFGTIGTSTSDNRTLTHEMGHYLGLDHPFKDGCNGGDNCIDTPPVASASFGCNFNRNSCSNDSPDLVDQIENYMDYSDCSNMFTTNQKTIMRLSLGNINLRGYLIQPSNYAATGIQPNQVLPCTPEVLYKMDRSQICEGESIQFTDLSLRGNPTSYQWTFQGGTPSTSTQANPLVQYNTPGAYDVSLKVSNASGSETILEYHKVAVRFNQPVWINQFTEDFEAWDIPNNNWHTETDSEYIGFETNPNVGKTGSKSAYIENFNIQRPVINSLITNSISLENSKSVSLSFDYAYTRKLSTSSTDALVVHTSIDCGKTWTMRKFIGGVVLKTANETDNAFTPNGGQWKSETINLSNLAFEPSVLVKFEFKSSGGGNNFYLDNVNMNTSISIEEQKMGIQEINIYPNPSNDIVNVEFETTKTDSYTLNLMDLSGKKVMNLVNDQEMATGRFSQAFNLSHLAAGMYLIEIRNNEAATFKRLIIQ